ncbi:MAG: glycosyltransferase [Lysobacter sp.]|nr:glycosyltransferase [Lysobacter sp.]
MSNHPVPVCLPSPSTSGGRSTVIHVVENLNRGGLERVVIDLIRAQRAAGMCCRVICLFEPGPLANELIADGVDVRACNKRHGLDLRALSRMRTLLREDPGAVLHSHNAVAHYYAALAAVGLRLGRVVNTRHAMPVGGGAGRREWLYRRSMCMTDVAVAVCETARLQLQRQGVCPSLGLVAIPNGIELERFLPVSAQARRQLAETLEVPPDTLLIGTVGRLNEVKDHATLIRAFRLVHEALPATALLLIGGGALRAQLETVARTEGVDGAVYFFGDRGDVDVLLRGLDLFAMSSLTEGYSVALLEASAVALPIVATDVGGNAEIVRQDVSGQLVPASDPKALAAAMISLLRDRERAAAMGRAGREWVLGEGSFQSMAARYAGIYGQPTAQVGANP